MLSNTEWSIHNFRSELIKKLLSGCCGVIRAGGKRPFATNKSRYGLVQTRFMGLVKNMTAYGIAAIAHNLRQEVVIPPFILLFETKIMLDKCG